MKYFDIDEDGNFWLLNGEERVGVFGDCLVPEQYPGHVRDFEEVVGVLSQDEIKKLIAGREPFRQRYPEIKAKNQNPTNGCNGYSAAGSLERQRVRRGLSYVPLHGCSIWTQMNGGRNVGTALAHAMEVLSGKGASPESLCPGRTFQNFNQMSAEAKAAMVRFKGAELYRLTNEAALATAAALEFDIGIAVEVDGSYNRLDKKGRMTSGHGTGNHAVGCDDIKWDDELGCFIYGSMGSWDRTWGDEGYGWFIYDRQLAQTIKYHAFYAIRTTNDDPEDPTNPPRL
jgi:hypothetical protein